MTTVSEKKARFDRLPAYWGVVQRDAAKKTIASLIASLEKIREHIGGEGLRFSPAIYPCDAETLDNVDELVAHLRRHLEDASEFELFRSKS